DPTGHHAETSWDLGAAWDTRPTAAGCALASRRVYVAIRLTLPEWRAPAGAGSDLLGAWSAYSEALWTHERGHAARAMRAAEDLAATLDELPAAPSCLDVNRAARSRLVAAVSWLQTEQDIYDAATEHGATQGAQLPIPTRSAPRSVLSTPPAGTTRRASQAIHSAR
ncbi:MAG TPA: DUF922 domain-containing protein, partial [Myxococcota bacterium]|nr:DUF922 domain-containing protein [Myxococcota bacterium]